MHPSRRSVVRSIKNTDLKALPFSRDQFQACASTIVILLSLPSLPAERARFNSTILLSIDLTSKSPREGEQAKMFPYACHDASRLYEFVPIFSGNSHDIRVGDTHRVLILSRNTIAINFPKSLRLSVAFIRHFSVTC